MIETGVELFRLMDLGEEKVLPIIPKVPTVDRTSRTIGYARVYSTYLLHALRAAR